MQSIFSILTSSSFCSLHKGRTRGAGRRWATSRGERRGEFQSDRPTEKSDNERSGLSGVQTPSRAKIAARGKEQGEWGVGGGGSKKGV